MKKAAWPLPFLLLLVTACAAHIPPPQTPAKVSGSPQQAWANVLSSHVDEVHAGDGVLDLRPVLAYARAAALPALV